MAKPVKDIVLLAKSSPTKIALTNLLGLFAIYYIFQIYSKSFSHIKALAVDYRFASLSLFAMVIALYLQSIRLNQMLKPLFAEKIKTFSATILIHFFNLFLPSKLGEVAGPFIISKKYNKKFSVILYYSFLSRYLDMVILGALILGTSFLITLQSQNFPNIFVSFFVLLLVLAGGLILAIFFQRNEKWAKYLPKFLKEELEKLVNALKTTYKPKPLAILLAITGALWGFHLLSYYFLLLAIELPLAYQSFEQTLILTIVGAVGHAIPSTPSGIGTYNLSIIFGLEVGSKVFGLSIDENLKGQFITASILFYLFFNLPDLILGIFYFFKEKKHLY